MLVRVFEAENTNKVYVLVNDKNNPLILQNHLWFFDAKLGNGITEFNKKLKDNGFSVKQLSVKTDNSGDILKTLSKDKKNIIVDTKEDMDSLISFIEKNIKTLTKNMKDASKGDIQNSVDSGKKNDKKGLAFTIKEKTTEDLNKVLAKKNMKMVDSKSDIKGKDIIYYGVVKSSLDNDGTWNIGSDSEFFFFYDEASAKKKYDEIENPTVRGKRLAKLNSDDRAMYCWVISLD